jgi:geranylgeranyl pyrophosphate synthase
MACRLGALTGTTDAALLDLYERWGIHFGTAAQLANDLHDATSTGRKSDLELGRGTMPLIYFGQRDESADRIVGSGALHFTWVVLEIERQACRDLLEQLAAQGQAVAQLRELLGS